MWKNPANRTGGTVRAAANLMVDVGSLASSRAEPHPFGTLGALPVGIPARLVVSWDLRLETMCEATLIFDRKIILLFR